MSFLSPFPYMPMGSYSLMGRRITYRMDLSADLRKRFEADVAEKAEETRRNNERVPEPRSHLEANATHDCACAGLNSPLPHMRVTSF